MRPYVILHMGISIDGRIVTKTWPKNLPFGGHYERLHKEFDCDAWIVGRITMAEFAKGKPKPMRTREKFPRKTWVAPKLGQGPYAIALDAAGRLHMNTDKIVGDGLIHILTESVSDRYLAELRRDGISYLFAGRKKLDLARALEKLQKEFGVKRLLLEGGGGINGSFLAAKLIDEISVLVLPLADGSAGMPTLFDRKTAPAVPLYLSTCSQLDGGVIHLRYTLAKRA